MNKNLVRTFSIFSITTLAISIAIKNRNVNLQPANANNPTSGAIYYEDSVKYYQGIDDSLKGEELMNALCELTTSGFVNQSYKDLVDLYPLSDINDDNKIVMLYTGTPLSYSAGSMPSKTNKEHVWPQSWYGPVTGTGSGGPGADGHNVWICDGQLNNVRSSFSFGEMTQDLSKRVYERGSSGSYGEGGGGNLEYANHAYLDYMVTANDDNYPEGVSYLDAYCYTNKSNIFYPRRGSRGMVARTLMYVATRYRLNNSYTVELVDKQITDKTGKLGKLSTLLKWHYEEPPTEYEMKRNNAVSKYWHHNRNPFVDHPEYASRIYYYLNEPGESAPSDAVKEVIEVYGGFSNTGGGEGGGSTSSSSDSNTSSPTSSNSDSGTSTSTSSNNDSSTTSSSNNSSSTSSESVESTSNEEIVENHRKGCNGSIAGSSIFLFVFSLTGLGIVLKKKKEK